MFGRTSECRTSLLVLLLVACAGEEGGSTISSTAAPQHSLPPTNATLLGQHRQHPADHTLSLPSLHIPPVQALRMLSLLAACWVASWATSRRAAP
jgi:hypothetical protein